MTSTESESTSPVSQDDQPLRTSRSSSATAASSATSASFDLSDLEEDDHHQPDVAIAGLDKGFDELDLGGGSEVAGGDVKQPNRAEEAVDVDHVGKDPRGTEEVSEKEGKDDTVERPEGYDEEDPVYPYTMALFEYTKRQYLEARWQHEQMERDQHKRQRGKKSGMEQMAARKAAMANKNAS